MISDFNPIRNNTAVRRRCSSASVPSSLNSGTTIDNCGAPGALRDMTKAPSRDMREIVSDQIDALADEKRATIQAGQQRQLVLSGIEQPRARLLQCSVDMTGMDHQLRHAWTGAAQQHLERDRIQDAGMNASDEPGSTQAERCGGAIVAACPRPHCRVKPRLTARGA